MALFDDASLVVTPNGYKEGTLYSIKPTSGLGDMTVVRATTATRVNSAGLIESVANNVPRLDYSNGSCPSLLVEPQRTNIVLYSEQFNNAAWTTSAFNATVTANTTISPDGTQNADTVVFGASGYLYQQFAITGLASATFSIYSKSATQIIIFGGGTAVGTDVYTTVNVGNGWFRQILTRTFTGGGTGILQPLPFGNNVTAFLWGAQLEVGSYPTSYIPTTSAAVTRNADAISKTGISSLIGQTEGVMFTDFVCVNNSSYCDVMSIGTDGTTGVMELQINGAASNTLRATYFYGGFVANIPALATLTIGQRYKAAFAYKSNDFVFYLNGVQQGTDTSGTVVSGMSEVSLNGYNSSTANKENALINSAILFPTRLTNAELASLTTI